MKNVHSFRNPISLMPCDLKFPTLPAGGGSPVHSILAIMLLLFAFLNLPAQPQSFFYPAWAQTGGAVSPGFTNRVVTVTGSGTTSYSASSVLLSANNYGMRLTKYTSSGNTSWIANFDLGAGGPTHVGRERVPLHKKVLHPNLYFNIDALYGLGQDGFFMRFVCKPGSNPGLIRLRFKGHTALSVETDGSLRIASILEDLILAPPTAVFSDAGGTESNASWNPQYILVNDSTVRIVVGTVPNGSSLIIKTGRDINYGGYSEFYWSTYYGDTGDEEVISIDTDTKGDIYFTGTTTSSMFPVQNAIQDQLFGNRDAFSGRFNYQGVRDWVTFFGGNKAADSPLGDFRPTTTEYGLDIAVGSTINGPESEEGSVFFVGRTDALDFPLLQKPNAFFDDKFYLSPNNWSYRGFIVELTKDGGTVEWSTYFGDAGTGSASFPSPQEGVTIAKINNQGNLVIGGPIERTDFPNFVSSFPTTASGVQYSQTSGTGFIAEFDQSGALIWATELACGGSSTQLGVHDIAFSSNDDIYIVGQSNFANFCDEPFTLTAPAGGYLKSNPTGQVDGWIMKFDADRSLIWSTYFGGDNEDVINTAIVDKDDNLVVIGSTNSSNLAVQNLGIGNYFD
jgi:hypothetical protein